MEQDWDKIIWGPWTNHQPPHIQPNKHTIESAGGPVTRCAWFPRAALFWPFLAGQLPSLNHHVASWKDLKVRRLRRSGVSPAHTTGDRHRYTGIQYHTASSYGASWRSSGTVMPLFRFLQDEGHSTAWKLTLKTIEPEAHRSEKGPVRKKIFHTTSYWIFLFYSV